jgi:hypothetical protein
VWRDGGKGKIISALLTVTFVETEEKTRKGETMKKPTITEYITVYIV